MDPVVTRVVPRSAALRATALAGFVALLVTAGGGLGASAAAAADSIPEQVEQYFSESLVPRLTQLYLPRAGGASGIAFDETTTVGPITRLHGWTADFLAGTSVTEPAELRNEWVAALEVAAQPVGLAIVWINPSNDRVELATFYPDATLPAAIAAAPAGSVLIHDEPTASWLALGPEGEQALVTPLVAGGSMIAGPIGLAQAQKAIRESAPARLAAEAAAADSARAAGTAGLVLGLVVLLLTAFVFLPRRAQKAPAEAPSAPDPGDAPAPEFASGSGLA